MSWKTSIAGLWLALSVLGLSLGSGLAEASPDVQVLSLYDVSAYVPGVLLPFQVQGGLLSLGTINGFNVTTNNGADCRIMKDPYLAAIYLVKCATPGQVTLHFNIASAGTSYAVDYGPVSIADPGLTVGVSPTPAPPTPAEQGHTLWQSYGCASCHGVTQSMPGHVSAPEISNAFQAHVEMAAFRGLSSADVSLLSAYLQSL